MAKLKFLRIEASNLTAAERAYVARITEDYETGGAATHVAHTEFEELAVAFPLREGGLERLLLVGRMGEDPSEYTAPYTDAQLEAGIKTGLTL